MSFNKKKQQLYSLVFCVLCFVLPFEKELSAIPNIVLGVLVVLSFFVIEIQDLKAFIIQEKFYQIFTFFCASILMFSLINGEINNDLFFFQKLLIPFILIPLSIPLKNTIPLKITFIISVLIAVLISVFNIINYFNSVSEFRFVQGSFINEVLIGERLYIGFTCVISLVLSLHFYQTMKVKKILRFLFLINATIILIFLFFIAARIAIISSLFVLIYFFFKKIKTNYKFIIVLGIILFFGLFIKVNPNLSKRFLHIDDIYSDSFFEKIRKHEPRYEIWYCSIGFIDFNKELVLGNGYNKTKDLLVNCYGNNIEKLERKNWFIRSRFNTHNQFLDILLSSGCIVFLMFLYCLYVLMKINYHSFLNMALLSVLILIMLVENILHRQIGCYLFAFITIIFLKNREYLKAIGFKENKF